jgi:hypothetical protein
MQSAPSDQPAQPVEAALPVQSPTRTVAVTVVEVAGAQAYLRPGASAGVLRGSTVTLSRQQYTVIQASDSFATIAVGDDPPHEQDKGQASVIAEKGAKAVELAKPAPLAAWDHRWPDPVPPSSVQTPVFVPLGTTERDRRWDVRLSATAGGLLPLGQRGPTLIRAELDARVHAEPFEAPAAFDLDVSVQRWFDPHIATRDGADARPTIYLRELLASYGAGGWYGGFGRMRYAARTLGTLDGARVSAPLGAGFSIGAFGGALPDPLSNAPSTAAERFGVEAVYSRPDTDLRPELAVVAQGSTFEGALDERRLSGVFALYPGPSRLGGHFEVSAFDAGNPWGAKPVELTGAGFDTSVRRGVFQIDGRFDLRQPERSRWLASYLPASWFCTTVPLPVGAPAGPEDCDGRVSTRAYSTVDFGIQADRYSIMVGGTRVADLAQTAAPQMIGGFATGRVVRIAKVLRFDASASYSHATYLDMLSETAGPGLTLLGDALDLAVYYRGSTLRYRSIHSTLVQHGAGGSVTLFPSAAVLFALQGEAMTGPDVKALMLFGTATWRPSF